MARIKKGPSTRLSTSRGWRRTSASSLAKKESIRMMPLITEHLFACAVRIFFRRLLHQNDEDVVERRLEFLGVAHVDGGVGAELLDHLRNTRAGVVHIDMQGP